MRPWVVAKENEIYINTQLERVVRDGVVHMVERG
jgi:hypothetical protein